MLKDSTAVIGLGLGGMTVTYEFQERNYLTYSVNGSEQDIKSIPNAKNSMRLEGYDGLAGNRELAYEALKRNKHVSVLNADMTKNLWDFMGNPGSFLNDYSDGEKFGVKNVDNSSSVVNQFDNLTFNLPNVQNSDDFIKEMAKNKKFEKMVCAMTIDRIRGGSSLAKYKYKH